MEKKKLKKFVQIANVINNWMTTENQNINLIDKLGHLLEKLEKTTRDAKKLRKALYRKSNGTTRGLLNDLKYNNWKYYNVYERIDAFRIRRGECIGIKSLVNELIAIDRGFGEIKYNRDDHYISIITSPVTLKDVAFGRFEIRYYIKGSCFNEYRCIALEPHYSKNKPELSHPHVSRGRLCEGEAALPIENAANDGRLYDFFALISQVLHSYTPGDAYQKIDYWDHIRCPDCGRLATEMIKCPECDTEKCTNCITECDLCCEQICRRCTKYCMFCQGSVCPGCNVRCTKCGVFLCLNCSANGLCPTCEKTRLEEIKKEELRKEAEENERLREEELSANEDAERRIDEATLAAWTESTINADNPTTDSDNDEDGTDEANTPETGEQNAEVHAVCMGEGEVNERPVEERGRRVRYHRNR